jgi:hypothetical protein
MSIETIKTEITRFLESEPPEVMAIKGKWGTGKTHLWNKLLGENKDKIKFGKYSYVSLFGINSLDVFKYAIFENTVNRNLIGKEISVEAFQEDSTGLLKTLGIKSLDILKSKSNSHAVESLAFLSIRNTLICIDDLERKGKNLDIKDILGLVSLLKEQRNCKVVLLLNEGEEGLKDYATYCEKVVDIELVFAPTAKENVEIAFGDTNDDAIKIVKESAIKLNIKNIRVLKQIERFVGLVIPYLSDCEPEITQQVASSLTLFAWCHYCRDSNVPSLDYIASTKNFYFGFDEEKNETDEQKKQKEWKTTILDYGFTHTDDLDLLLIQLVKTGYIIEIELSEKLKQKNAEAITSKSKTTFHSCWNLFHDCLDNNETEIVSAFYKNFKTNVKYYSNSELRLVVHLFRELEENDKAEELIDLYINSNNSDIEQFNLKWADHKHITDASMIKKFNEFYQSVATKETAEHVLDRIAGLNGWNPEDLIILANTSVDDYYELFKSINNYERRTSFIKKCLEFGQFENPDSEYKEIANRATQALKRIASECRINKIRLQHFGIEVD